jgi:hypothetical protein
MKKCLCVKVPNLETGKMEPLMAGDNKGFLTKDEELQFKSMITRLHTLFKVPYSALYRYSRNMLDTGMLEV